MITFSLTRGIGTCDIIEKLEISLPVELGHHRETIKAKLSEITVLLQQQHRALNLPEQIGMYTTVAMGKNTYKIRRFDGGWHVSHWDEKDAIACCDIREVRVALACLGGTDWAELICPVTAT